MNLEMDFKMPPYLWGLSHRNDSLRLDGVAYIREAYITVQL